MTGVDVMLMAMFVATSVSRGDAQSTCQRRLETVTVCQRCYVELTTAFRPGRVYLWAPDIKTGFVGGGFDPFQLWIVEGVYGKPFPRSTGSLDESRFNQIRSSQNVAAMPITVDRQSTSKPKTFKIGKDLFVLQVDKVNASWGGTDSVTVSICQ